MPTAVIDGIKTNYEVHGDGPPLLMYSPGGFDASLDKWSNLGVYARIKLLDHLPGKYRCIIFDRRETGQSGGRVERITWDDYVEQGRGLLAHLGYDAAHLMGGCMGCCPVVAYAARYPQSVLSMILYWPVGGARFRIKGHGRFAQHLGLVEQEGLAGVVELARKTKVGFGKDPRVGPWAPVIRSDAEFAAAYAAMDVDRYKLIVAGMPRTLLDRDTAPGAEPEDLLRLDIPALIVPGKDIAHATSAARYLEECLPAAEYWDILPDAQTEANVPAKLIEFLDRVS
ncbi:MAG: alpha/beta hydrolase [Gammaproteobacteria bacterium]|nr:alpha/beta hydrolase [Gammaproteobacteria bacterium]